VSSAFEHRGIESIPESAAQRRVAPGVARRERPAGAAS